MSDGPHRSLPMRRAWKKVAEFADIEAFAEEDISKAISVAIGKDWRDCIPDRLSSSISDILDDQQDSLFSDQKVARLETLRPLASGYGFAQVLLECAIRCSIGDVPGHHISVDAATRAIAIWASRHSRQVEEHYCRKSSLPRARNVRARIESGIGSASLGTLARELLKPDHGNAPVVIPKHTGLDEGVRL